MDERQRPSSTGLRIGLTLGAAFGLLFWTLTGNVLFFGAGVALGLVLGAAGDGFAQRPR